MSQLRTWLRRDADDPLPPPAAPVALHLVANDSGPDLPFGIWPDDPDTVPQWRIDVERKAHLRGLDIPGYRTRAEFESAVALCESALSTTKAKAVLLPPLSPPDAAMQFLRWMQSTGRTGRYTDERLAEAYSEHCATIGRAEASQHMRKHLADLSGADKTQEPVPGAPKRKRITIWVISPSLKQVVDQRRLAA